MQAVSTGGHATFIGIAPSADVDRWLEAVPHEHVSSINVGPFSTETQQIPGTARPLLGPVYDVVITEHLAVGAETERTRRAAG